MRRGELKFMRRVTPTSAAGVQTYRGHSQMHRDRRHVVIREGWWWLISQAVLRLRTFCSGCRLSGGGELGGVCHVKAGGKLTAEETVLILHPRAEIRLSVCPLSLEAGSCFIVVSSCALRDIGSKGMDKFGFHCNHAALAWVGVRSPADPSVVGPHPTPHGKETGSGGLGFGARVY